MMKAAKNTWNFLKQLATLAHGCASEKHLSRDVNMRRLPEKTGYNPKFPVPLAVFM